MLWPMFLLIVPIWLGGYLGSQRMPLTWVKKKQCLFGGLPLCHHSFPMVAAPYRTQWT